jgi:DNA-binding transcriptional MerR regulator
LHHYDRVGLLKPTGRSAAGYRLYGAGDFARLQQVLTLKFMGMPLRQIKEVLGRKELDAALRAVREAESVLSRGGGPAWDEFKKIVEVISMQHDTEWMKRYYTEEQLADLARRGTPEVLERGQSKWQKLIAEVEEAAREGVDPASERAQGLAARWQGLIEEFTGGDPGILENLKRLYADQANWPDTFRKPYSDESADFISRARAAKKE